MQTAFIQKKTKFTSDNPYVSNMINKSKFKLSVKAGKESEIFVSGKIFADCQVGKTISEGTKFYAQNSQGKEVEFISTKTVKSECFEEIWVYCCEGGEEATKNQITECSIPAWREKIIGIGNSKIGFTKKTDEQKKKGGKIFNYLYSKEERDIDWEDLLEEKYFDKLSMILEGTQLSSTKLNQIIRGKEKHITRNDLLTLSFLAYVSEQENERIEKNNAASEDYDQRMIYFRVKEYLLSQDIGLQYIETDKMLLHLNEDTRKGKTNFAYTLQNISIAINAKLGGTPWCIDVPTKEELVIGVGAVKVDDVQYIGSAFSFANTGAFNSFDYFHKDELLELAGAIEDAIIRFKEEVEPPKRLVIHYFKDMREDEVKVIEKMLYGLKLGDIPIYIVTINKTEAEDLIVFDHVITKMAQNTRQ